MSKAESKINIRVDKTTKERAQKTFNDLGLDLSSGIKLFLKSVITTQSIPFEIRTKNGYTYTQESSILEETQEAIAEYKKGKGKSFSNTRDLIKSLL